MALVPDRQETSRLRSGLTERIARPIPPPQPTDRSPPEDAGPSRRFAPLPTAQDLAAPRVEAPRERQPGAERRERPRIAPRVMPVKPQEPVNPISLPALERTLLDQAIEVILSRSVELFDQIDPDEKPPVDLVLDHGRETVEQVLGILSRGGSTHIRRISHSLGEIEDLILLMQLEKGRAPADDALTLLLQLRREMETLRAT